MLEIGYARGRSASDLVPDHRVGPFGGLAFGSSGAETLLSNEFGLHVHCILPFNRRRLAAKHTRFHSPRTFSDPLRLKLRKFVADLIQPKTGSTIHFRFR